MPAEDQTPPPWANPSAGPPAPSDYSSTPGWTDQPGPPPPYGYWPTPVQQAPRPGLIPLRPLGVGELLDGAFTMIRRYPAATLGLTAVVMLVVETARVIASYYLLHGVHTTTLGSGNTVNTGVGDVTARASTVAIAASVLTLVATSILTGMIAAVVGRGALGLPMSAAEAWAATRTCFWKLLGATLLISLIGAAITAVGVIPGVIVLIAGSFSAGIILIALGGLAAGLYAFYVVITLSFTTPALMLEQLGIMAAMRRSRVLVKTSWWRVLGILLLGAIIAEVLTGVIGTPFALAGAGFSGLFSGHAEDQYRFTPLLLQGIGALVAAVLVRPFSAGLTALLYLDRRMRSEALDLTLQQAATAPTR